MMSVASWFLPNGKVAFHHAPNSLLFTRKPASDSDSDKPTQISLVDVCKEATPTKCQLNPLLFNGHLQTMWTVMKLDDVPVHYKRWRFEAQNPDYSGTYEVDFVVDPYDTAAVVEDPDAPQPDPKQPLPVRTSFYTVKEFAALPSDDTKPMLIVLHGLSGGSHESYLRHIVHPLTQNGWDACVVNFRGCAQSKVSSSILYNARATWDVRQTVRWVREKFPNRPLFGIGFSLGGNILTNYLGEEGDDCVFKAAVICSNPWNLDVSSVAMRSTWIGREVYSTTMGSNMKRLFEKHVNEVSKHPRVDVEKVRSSKYLHEFDRALQAPVWGYPTESAYYRDASSIDSIFAIKVPFFVVQAEDDPISVKESLPYHEMTQTPYGVMMTTTWGGHLSWFETGGTRWFTKPITAFLNKMATEINGDVPFEVPEGSKSNHKVVPAASASNGPTPDFAPMRRKQQMPI